MRKVVVSTSLAAVLALTGVVIAQTAQQSKAKAVKIVGGAAGYGNAQVQSIATGATFKW